MALKKKKIELLAPAGSFEKLKYAVCYGADAVYAGLPDISMRARVNSFTEKELKEAAEYVHEAGKKIFVTLNIYAHNYHLPKIERHIKFLKEIKVDAVIVSDPGIIMLVKKLYPEVEIHLSTQANTTNWQAAKFWYDLGIKRIVLAREVTLEDIKEIHKRVPKLELEYFVHGAMCMSYSGRCILSKWMTNKSANLGDCSQPCRWSYKKVESEKLKIKSVEKAQTMKIKDIQGEHEIELEQDSHGTYFFNSKDLNLIEHLKELKDAGVTSFKIEGRNKSCSYVASVVRSYRMVLSALESNMTEKEYNKITKQQSKELNKLMNRGYTKGFLLGNEPEHNFTGSHEEPAYQFVGEILEADGKIVKVKVHNAIYGNEKLEIFGKENSKSLKILKMFNDKMEPVVSAHGGHERVYYFEINRKDAEKFSLIRKVL